MKSKQIPDDLFCHTDAMLDRLARNLCNMTAFYLGAAARHLPQDGFPRWLVWERQQKLRLLCELRMLFERCDLAKPADLH